MKKNEYWKTGVATFAAVTLALGLGCGDGHDHAGHDQDHDHEHEHVGHDHDHEGAENNSGGGDVAAKPADAKPYTLETCIVSDEKLGSMGKPVVRVHEGQEVKFCCDSCIEDFEKEPKKFLTKLAK
jgi:hypothetical protein